MAGADTAAVFVVIPIEEVVAAILDTPVPAIDVEQPLRVGLIGWPAGNAVSDVV